MTDIHLHCHKLKKTNYKDKIALYRNRTFGIKKPGKEGFCFRNGVLLCFHITKLNILK